jgi:hypothetical protein
MISSMAKCYRDPPRHGCEHSLRCKKTTAAKTNPAESAKVPWFDAVCFNGEVSRRGAYHPSEQQGNGDRKDIRG